MEGMGTWIPMGNTFQIHPKMFQEKFLTELWIESIEVFHRPQCRRFGTLPFPQLPWGCEVAHKNLGGRGSGHGVVMCGWRMTIGGG